MATTRDIPIRRLESGEFPHRCVVTGQPTDRFVTVRLSTQPVLPWVLVPFAPILAIFLLIGRRGPTVRARIPVSLRASKTLAWTKRAHWASGWGGAALLVGALAIPDGRGTLLILGFIALAVAVIATTVGAVGAVGAIGTREGRERGSLRLTGVHSQFASALDAELVRS